MRVKTIQQNQTNQCDSTNAVNALRLNLSRPTRKSTIKSVVMYTRPMGNRGSVRMIIKIKILTYLMISVGRPLTIFGVVAVAHVMDKWL